MRLVLLPCNVANLRIVPWSQLGLYCNNHSWEEEARQVEECITAASSSDPRPKFMLVLGDLVHAPVPALSSEPEATERRRVRVSSFAYVPRIMGARFRIWSAAHRWSVKWVRAFGVVLLERRGISPSGRLNALTPYLLRRQHTFGFTVVYGLGFTIQVLHGGWSVVQDEQARDLVAALDAPSKDVPVVSSAFRLKAKQLTI